MKKIKLSVIISLFISIIISFGTAIFLLNFNNNKGFVAFADESGDNRANINFLLVLDETISCYNGINTELEFKLRSYGAKQIKDLSAIPINMLNNDGSINVEVAPNLADYYKNNSFKQILSVYFGALENSASALKENIEKTEGILSVCLNNSENVGEWIPNDSRIDEQWGLRNSYNPQYGGVSVYYAWDSATGSKNVRVGVIDSGIADHDDLNANVVEGYDFYNKNTITTDDYGGHGTHVAGIIGAVGNNSIGISGVAQNISLVPLQTASSTYGSGSHNPENLVEAIVYARNLWETSQRISILNFSIGGFGSDISIYDGILAAIESFPGLFVWSAGNNNEDLDRYPNIDRYNLPNLISVGAINNLGDRVLGTNYGLNSVDIYAPGQNILSTVPYSVDSSGYKAMDGTSMAAPYVTGVAALMLSMRSTLTATKLKEYIMYNADMISINAGGAVQRVRKLNAYKAAATVYGTLPTCVEEYSAENLIEIVTLYDPDCNYGEWADQPGCITEGEGVVGYSLQYNYAYCHIFENTNGNRVEYNLYIKTDRPTGSCWLLNSNKQFLLQCFVENYQLYVPLIYIYTSGELIFYLYPDEGSSDTFSFTPSDITIEIKYKLYI